MKCDKAEMRRMYIAVAFVLLWSNTAYKNKSTTTDLAYTLPVILPKIMKILSEGDDA